MINLKGKVAVITGSSRGIGKSVAEKAEFDKFNFKEGNVEVLSNTGVEFLKDADKIKEELYHQTFGPVRWVEIIEKLRDTGVTKFYEIGPGKVLKGLVRKIDKTLEVVNVESI